MSAGQPKAYVFGPFRLLVARRELLAHGVPIVLGQRALDVLLAIVRRRGQIATKDEIMAEVWPGVVVEENNLQVHISALRKVLATAGGEQRYLVTVAGRGYQFVAPVEEHSDAAPTSPSAATDRRAAAPATMSRRNLPLQATTLIGRDEELAAIDAALQRHRVVTLTGPGGVGKTRLAIEAARRAAHCYSHGVRFCEFAPLDDPQGVAPTIAEALGVTLEDAAAPLQALASAVGSQHLLLILDNCEHLIAEAARAAETLVSNCPQLSVLSSSRERLAIAGESIFVVPSLAAPEPQRLLRAAEALEFPAVRLFEERASALVSGFTTTDDNVRIIASICQALDGLPLAIEMAVPRLKVMSLQQLSGGLDERFRLLRTGARTALPRHQTLHGLIAWSYELLSPAERSLLRRASVFVGSTSLDSIDAVVNCDVIARGDALDLVSSLAEKSLIVVDAADAEPRYRLLESTRHFARDKLAETGELGALFTRHSKHFATRLADASAAWETTATHQWLAKYAPDIDNVRAAFQWGFGPDGDVGIALELTAHSHELWAELGLVTEHRRWVNEALSRLTPATPDMVLAQLLSWQAGDVKDLDDPTDYEDALRASAIYAAAEDSFNQGKMLLRAGTALLSPSTPQESEELLKQSLALLEPFGPRKSLARCLSALASARLFVGDRAKAASLHTNAMAIYRDLGEPS